MAVRWAPTTRSSWVASARARGSRSASPSTVDPFRRLRLDYDPVKGPHFNAEVGKGGSRIKHAFKFPGTEETALAHFNGRKPRG